MAATCFHKTLLWSLLNSLLFFLFSRKVAANHGTADLPVLAVSDCLALFPCLPRSSGPATARLRGCCWPAPQSSQEGQALWLSTESSPNLLNTLGQKIQWQQRTRSYNTQSGAPQKVIPESSSSPTGGNSLFPACLPTSTFPLNTQGLKLLLLFWYTGRGSVWKVSSICTEHKQFHKATAQHGPPARTEPALAPRDVALTLPQSKLRILVEQFSEIWSNLSSE